MIAFVRAKNSKTEMMRSIDPLILRNLPSVEIINYSKDYDWRKISQTKYHIERQGLDKHSKDWLMNILFEGKSEIALRICCPTIACIRVSPNEYRDFIFTSEGVLLEPDYLSIWDHYFTTFFSDENKPTGMLNPQKIFDLPGSYHWLRFSHNYTHFLHDGLSPLLAQLVHFDSLQENKNLLFLGDRRHWSDEFLSKLNMNLCNIVAKGSLTYFWVKPRELFLTYESNYIERDKKIRAWIKEKFNLRDVRPNPRASVIIFNDRSDSRENRISTINEIREFARRHGILSALPVNLSIPEKWNLYNSANICISESSGNMNPAIFSDNPTKLIGLANHASSTSLDMIFGGWSHSIGYLDRNKTLWGHDIKKREGAIAPSEYNIELLKELLISSW